MEKIKLELTGGILRSEGRYEIEVGSDYVKIKSFDRAVKVTIEGEVLLSVNYNPAEEGASVGKSVAKAEKPASQKKPAPQKIRQAGKGTSTSETTGETADRLISELKGEGSLSNRQKGPKLTIDIARSLRKRFPKMAGSETERIKKLTAELKKKKFDITESGVRKIIKKETWKEVD